MSTILAACWILVSAFGCAEQPPQLVRSATETQRCSDSICYDAGACSADATDFALPDGLPDLQQTCDELAGCEWDLKSDPSAAIDAAIYFMRSPHSRHRELAREWLDEVLRIFPTHPRAAYCRALLHDDRGNFKEALKLLAYSARAYPQDAFVHYYRGQSLYALGDLDAAEQSFRTALRHSPQLPEAHLGLYRIARKLDRELEAAACLKAFQTLRREPSRGGSFSESFRVYQGKLAMPHGLPALSNSPASQYSRND